MTVYSNRGAKLVCTQFESGNRDRLSSVASKCICHAYQAASRRRGGGYKIIRRMTSKATRTTRIWRRSKGAASILSQTFTVTLGSSVQLCAQSERCTVQHIPAAVSQELAGHVRRRRAGEASGQGTEMPCLQRQADPQRPGAAAARRFQAAPAEDQRWAWQMGEASAVPSVSVKNDPHWKGQTGPKTPLSALSTGSGDEPTDTICFADQLANDEVRQIYVQHLCDQWKSAASDVPIRLVNASICTDV